MKTRAEGLDAALPQRWLAVLQPTRVGIISGLIGALLFAGIGFGSTLRMPAAYESIAILVIDQPNSIAGAGGEGIIAKLNTLRVKYLFLAKTRRLTLPVAEKLKIPVAEVARSVVATAPGPSLIIFVTARTGSPTRSQQIADAMAEQLITYLNSEQEAAKVSPLQRIALSLVDQARPGNKVQPTVQRARSVAVFAAFIGFALLYGMAQLVVARRRS